MIFIKNLELGCVNKINQLHSKVQERVKVLLMLSLKDINIMISLFTGLRKASTPTQNGIIKNPLTLLKRLVKKTNPGQANNFMDNLEWNFMYIDNTHLNSAFRNNYAYGCILCRGAGFYDYSKLPQHNPLTGRRYLQELVIRIVTEFDKSKNASDKKDLGRYLSAVSSFTNTQKGPSIGLTLQVAPDYPVIADEGRPLSPLSIYPPHCHDAVEVYFSLNSQWIVDDASYSREAKVKYDTSKMSAGPASWQVNMASQFSSYSYFGPGDGAFLAPRIYYSMHPGRRLQFMAWARLNDPDGQTYLPFHGSPPPGWSCVDNI